MFELLLVAFVGLLALWTLFGGLFARREPEVHYIQIVREPQGGGGGLFGLAIFVVLIAVLFMAIG